MYRNQVAYDINNKLHLLLRRYTCTNYCLSPPLFIMILMEVHTSSLHTNYSHHISLAILQYGVWDMNRKTCHLTLFWFETTGWPRRAPDSFSQPKDVWYAWRVIVSCPQVCLCISICHLSRLYPASPSVPAVTGHQSVNILETLSKWPYCTCQQHASSLKG